MARFRVASLIDLPYEEAPLLKVDAGGTPVCLAYAEDGNYYAINDTCTHEEFSLSDGELWGMNVECPQHGSRFNLITGRVTGLPAVIPAKTYELTLSGDDVFVDIPD